MIRDLDRWRQFEDELIASEPPDWRRNLRLVDGMYDLARKLGVFPPADPLEGLEVDIRLAKVLRGVRTPA